MSFSAGTAAHRQISEQREAGQHLRQEAITDTIFIVVDPDYWLLSRSHQRAPMHATKVAALVKMPSSEEEGKGEESYIAAGR